MKDNKKSVIEEALAEFSLIQESLNSNTKEILRSVAKEEITSTLKESLYEDDYDIEDIDVDGEPEMGGDVDALPVDDAPEMTPDMGGMDGGSEELGIDDIGMDTADGDLGLGAEEGGEDYGMDMTAASDEEVISVYKKLSGEDEIEVVSSDEVIIKDPVSGSEYNVKMNGGSLIDQGEMSADDLGSEMDVDMDAEVELEPEGPEPEVDAAPEIGGDDESGESEEAPDFGGDDESEDDTDDEEVEEAVVYEIELSEDDAIEEGLDNNLKINKDSKIGDTADGEVHTAVSDVNMGNDVAATNTGDIEGQTAPLDSDSGDNLDGGFTDKHNGKGGNHAAHVMEGEDDVNETEELTEEDDVNESENMEGQKAPVAKPAEEKTHATGDAHAAHVMAESDDDINEDEEVVQEIETIDESEEDVNESEDTIDEVEEVNEDEDAIEEKIQVGKGRNVTNNKTSIEGAGGKANKVSAPNVTAPSGKLSEAINKYNALLAEAKELKKENDMFRNSLKDFRKSITETAVFNTNLTHVTKLFVEHSTTSDEKQNILTRFDEQVSTIEESKKLYKSIAAELGKKAPITESIDNKLVSDGKTSSQSAQLNETTAYVDPAQKRVLDLMRRTR